MKSDYETFGTICTIVGFLVITTLVLWIVLSGVISIVEDQLPLLGG